ncbi:MAG: type II secretion system F family protein [Chthoniobacteraceae bacterium]
MPAYSYIARKPSGARVNGTIDARDRQAAIARIELEAGVPINVDEAAETTSASIANPSATSSYAIIRLPLAQLFLFTEQLAHLLSAGMTLDESLAILVRRLESPKLKTLTQALHQALVDGRSLSQAMQEYPRIFSSLYVNMVAAGETSGALPQILRRLVTHLADIKALRDRVQQALLYPAFLVLAGIILIILFMTVMVPQLTKFLSTTGQALPAATQILIEGNHLITQYWWSVLFLAAAIGFAFKFLTRSPETHRAFHRVLWNFPALGRIPRYRFYAQFARTLATLGENGVTLLKSLELLKGISANLWVQTKLEQTRQAVMDGASLSQALRRDALFPPLFLDMMSVGEQTGRFAETMSMIADVHERELDKQVQFVSTIIPLVIIVLIAAVVGLIVFAILSAVFGLTSGLQGRLH